MSQIPSYDLYGEAPQPAWHESLHVESISTRSGAYDWEIAAHRHDGLLQILYVQQGSGEVLADSARIRMQAPCAIVIPAQTVHGFNWNGRVEGLVITAVQPPLEGVARILSPNLLTLLHKPHVLALPQWSDAEDPLLPLCRQLREEYFNREREHQACSMSLLLALLIHVLRFAGFDAEQPVAANSRRSQQVKAFRELVDSHYRGHRAVNEYASDLGVTVATLGRLCQEQLGMTPMAVINARLVLEAKRELAYSSLSIKEIAHDLGFSDVGYFSRFFRKNSTLTPSEFREASQCEERPSDCANRPTD
ncbi:helix-turn-helix domain-containing protein [Pseudomonas sp. X10]